MIDIEERILLGGKRLNQNEMKEFFDSCTVLKEVPGDKTKSSKIIILSPTWDYHSDVGMERVYAIEYIFTSSADIFFISQPYPVVLEDESTYYPGRAKLVRR